MSILIDVHIAEPNPARSRQLVRSSESMQMTRLIAMSNKLTDGQAQGLHAAGFDSFLKKPFQVRAMIESIERATNVLS